MAAPPRDRDQLLRELRSPAPVGGSAGINRHLHDLYLSRPDLRRAFPDLEGADARALVEWAHQYGQHEVPIGTDLLPDIDDDLRRAYAAPNGHGPPAADVSGFLSPRVESPTGPT